MEISKKSQLRFLLLGLFLLLAACGGGGGGSEDAPTTRNAHEPGWRINHSATARIAQAKNDFSECQVCHRADFKGGDGVPSCFECHTEGQPFSNFHPKQPGFEHLNWAHPLNHGRAAKLTLLNCQGCHGEPGGPGSNPRFNVTLRSLEGGCESLTCHGDKSNLYTDLVSVPPIELIDEVAHPVNAAHPGSSAPDNFWWFGQQLEFEDGTQANLGHWDVQDNMQACTLCHGLQGLGGSGPSCLECHVSNPFSNPSGCVSCHGQPPMPFGESKVTQYIAQEGRTPQSFRVDFFSLIGAGYHLGFNHRNENEYAACSACHFDDPTFVPPDPLEDPEGFQDFVDDPNRIVNRHHNLIGTPIPANTVAPYAPFNQPGRPYFCDACHQDTLVNGVFEFELPPQTPEGETDCAFCHFVQP